MADKSGALVYRSTGLQIRTGELDQCQRRYVINGQTKVIGIDVQRIVDVLHYLSAGLVSFARGLNDTPKIVALSVSGPAVGSLFGLGTITGGGHWKVIRGILLAWFGTLPLAAAIAASIALMMGR